MKSYAEMDYHPLTEKLVDVLVKKTQYKNPLFYRIQVGYYFSLVASMMRCSINTPDRGDIPVNMYAVNLSPSGTGKGFSTNIIESEVIHQFRNRFLEGVFPVVAEENLNRIAIQRAGRKGIDPAEELPVVVKEYESLGTLLFSFSEATEAAIKQMRHKLLMGNAGALGFSVDEIGSNLLSQVDALSTFLELYDVGLVKAKLIKNTKDNIRNEEIVGRTPANMLLFGTPSKLLNGGQTEEEFNSLLETGYARRCYFGFNENNHEFKPQTKEEVLAMMMDNSSSVYLSEIADKLEALANVVNIRKELTMSEATCLTLIQYRLDCEEAAHKLPEHMDIKKAELSHRYFKALKLAGAYAFVDGSDEVTEEHLYYAIKLAEDSGVAFDRIMNRPKPYERFAKYVCTAGTELTQADLVANLPYYKGSVSQKNELVNLAISYGYKNHYIIKRYYVDGVEFFKGETLKPTNLNKIIVSLSTDLAYGYEAHYAPFNELGNLTGSLGYHWANHHFLDGHRTGENAIAGFNMLVLDIDGTADIAAVRTLMAGYTYHLYTTKRHTEAAHRFRLCLPINYTLKLSGDEYKEILNNVISSLPFQVDEGANQRERKWLSHNGHSEFNDGELFDILPFIPQTARNDQRIESMKSQEDLDNLERWVLNNTGDGNRNNMLLRYGMILVDFGMDATEIQGKIIELNDKMPDKLSVAEIASTMMISISKAIAKKYQ